MSDAERSKEACPVCGQHSLTILPFPTMDVMGVQPYAELIGLGDPAQRPDSAPAIGCLNCGSDWPNLEEFRRAQKERGA